MGGRIAPNANEDPATTQEGPGFGSNQGGAPVWHSDWALGGRIAPNGNGDPARIQEGPGFGLNQGGALVWHSDWALGEQMALPEVFLRGPTGLMGYHFDIA